MIRGIVGILIGGLLAFAIAVGVILISGVKGTIPAEIIGIICGVVFCNFGLYVGLNHE